MFNGICNISVCKSHFCRETLVRSESSFENVEMPHEPMDDLDQNVQPPVEANIANAVDDMYVYLQ